MNVSSVFVNISTVVHLILVLLPLFVLFYPQVFIPLMTRGCNSHIFIVDRPTTVIQIQM